MILKKITLENFLTHEVLFNKTIRGNLDFTGEAILEQEGTILKLSLYRNHPRIKELIAKAQEKNMLTKQHVNLKTGGGVIRLSLNDDIKLMVNTANATIVDINELNFSPKDLSLVDFEKGKVNVDIIFTFDKEVDNLKFKAEVEKLFGGE